MKTSRAPKIIATITKSRHENILICIDKYDGKLWIEIAVCFLNSKGDGVIRKHCLTFNPQRLTAMIEGLQKAKDLTNQE